MIPVPFTGAGGEEINRDLTHLLPESGTGLQWKLNGTPDSYRGEDLFLMINGGAEIYHEYGFKQVIAASYIQRDGEKQINVEIYEMADPAAAFGMYTFKSSAQGESLPVGFDGRLEDYYLNFWKNRCLVTLTGFDAHPDTVEGLKVLARSIASRIPSRGEPPLLFKQFEAMTTGWQPEEITYLRGHLALYNRYPFFTQDIFKTKDGFFGKFADFRLFLLAYSNGEESNRRYQNILKVFKERGDGVHTGQSGFLTTDTRGNRLLFGMTGPYILVFVGEIPEILRSKFISILKRIPGGRQ